MDIWKLHQLLVTLDSTYHAALMDGWFAASIGADWRVPPLPPGTRKWLYRFAYVMGHARFRRGRYEDGSYRTR